MKLFLLSIFFLTVLNPVFSQIVLLQADGPGNTYELINSVFAPAGGDVVETPDCAHPTFGRHITEGWDAQLGRYVFEFQIHVTPDNDRCINFDRQRLEIKTYDSSPAYMKIVSGEAAEYKWKFKLPVGFQVSSSFTHIHQLKPVGGDESTPTFALTARKGTPNKLELSYYPTTDIGLQKLASASLSLFEGQWVEVTERFTARNTGGNYFIEIKNLASGAVIMTYQNNNISTFRSDNQFIRPKWGVYRSLNTPADLRDEIVLFNDFSIQEMNSTGVNTIPESKKQVKIFPNPAGRTTNLEYYAENDGVNNVSVTGLCGQTLLEKRFCAVQGKNEITLDLMGLDRGVYLVSIRNDALLLTEKIEVTF